MRQFKNLTPASGGLPHRLAQEARLRQQVLQQLRDQLLRGLVVQVALVVEALMRACAARSAALLYESLRRLPAIARIVIGSAMAPPGNGARRARNVPSGARGSDSPGGSGAAPAATA